MPVFDMGRAWSDALRLIARDKDIVYTVAGLFIFLPSLIVNWLGPQPAAYIPAGLEARSNFANGFLAYSSAAWPWLLVSSLFILVGFIALIRLMAHTTPTTPGEALRFSASMLPITFVWQVLSNILITGGLIALLLPGVLLLGRFFLAPAYLATDRVRGPIAALTQSWQATLRSGWSLAGLFLLVMLAVYLVGFLLSGMAGAVGQAVSGAGGAQIGSGFVQAGMTAIMTLLSAALRAASFRQIVETVPMGRPFE